MTAVLVVLNVQPQCWADRNVEPSVKRDQYETIAVAIAEASPNLSRAGYLLTIGWHESRWCLDVHSGKERGGRGEGNWQLEGKHHGSEPRSGLSLGATRSSARLASRHVQRSFQCGSKPEQVLTAYAGRPCWQAKLGWPTLTSRVRGYWRAVSALRQAGAT